MQARVRDGQGGETYVVPVTLARLEGGGTEAKGPLPFAGLALLGGVLRQGQLAGVVVPGTEQVDGLDLGAGGEHER